MCGLISSVPVFIYSMPGYSVSVRERMLYSSCKNAVTEVIEKLYSIEIAKKVEVDTGAELTEEYLQVKMTKHNTPDYIVIYTGRSSPSQDSPQAKVCQACSSKQREQENY